MKTKKKEGEPILSAKFKDTYTAEEMEQRKKQAQLDLLKVIDELTTHPDFTANNVDRYRAILSKTLHDISISYNPDDLLSVELSQTFENVLSKILAKASELETKNKDLVVQGELFNTLKLSETTNVKKDVVVSWISTNKIKEKYANLLNLYLPGDKKTLLQLLNEVEDWYKNLQGVDYGNWIKVFLFARAVKDHLLKEPDTIDVFEESAGKYRFLINVDKRFYNFFEKPIGTNKNGIKYHTSIQKDKIIKWLEKNSGAVEFPLIVTLPNQQKSIIPKAGKIFELKSALREDGKQQLWFSIDTNLLDDEFKNYVSFNRADIDNIEEAWKELNPKYGKETLSSFMDIPLRFLSTLKILFNRDAIRRKNKGLYTCTQKRKKENLDIDLGHLEDRINKFLISRDRIRTGKTSSKTKEIKIKILETTFKIAVDQKWLWYLPEYKDGVYTFEINPNTFDTRQTALLLNNCNSG